MMEFETVIMVGQNPTKVLFTGGSVNALGSHPAKYTTDSLMIQHSIERSRQYKTGLIKKIRTVELEDEIVIEKNPEKPEEVKVAAAEDSEESIVSEPETEEEPGKDSDEATESNSPEEVKEASAEEGEVSGLLHLEFEVNDDAKDYLEQNFGVARNKMKNRLEIIEAGRQNGVDIVFI